MTRRRLVAAVRDPVAYAVSSEAAKRTNRVISSTSANRGIGCSSTPTMKSPVAGS
jgi:hypothetical protein